MVPLKSSCQQAELGIKTCGVNVAKVSLVWVSVWCIQLHTLFWIHIQTLFLLNLLNCSNEI
uniref:Uncharacterized protein n=1 Tax=Anguilla anguilla TaxID=7936 RepID=A0A0E9XMH4_ANGAN